MRDLSHYEVLTRAKDLSVLCYRLTEGLPSDKRFGLRAQMNRAAVSVAANIAEGLGRGTAGDLERCLRVALGSAAELEVLVEVAARVTESLDEQRIAEVAAGNTIVRKQLNRLITQVSADRRRMPHHGQ